MRGDMRGEIIELIVERAGTCGIYQEIRVTAPKNSLVIRVPVTHVSALITDEEINFQSAT